MKKPFLSDLDKDKVLKQIKPVIAVFYRFTLPPEVASARHSKCKQVIALNNAQAHLPKEEYIVSEEEAESMLETATNTLYALDGDIQSYQQCYDIIVSLLS